MQKPEVELHTIQTIEDFRNLNAYVEEENFQLLTFDLETDGVVEKRAKIYGIGLCFQSGQAFYIPIRKPTTENYWSYDIESNIISTLQIWLSRIPVTGHNILFDNLVWEANYGWNFDNNIIADTMLMKHAIDEERPFGLKEISVKYLGEWADKAQDELKNNVLSKGGSWTAENKQMFLADTEILAVYCMWDVLLTRYLYDLFIIKLKEQKLEELFYTETMNLYRNVTIPMKRHGFPINVAHFEKLRQDITAEIDQVEDKVQDAIADMVAPFCQATLNKKVPIKPSGKFREALAYAHGVPIPINKKTGKATFAAKEIAKIRADNQDHENFYKWCLDDGELDKFGYPAEAVQLQLFFESNPEERYVFNLSSNDHLGWLFFQHLQLEPLGKTDGGKPKCDDDFLITLEKEFPWVSDLLTYKRLRKLEATYILGVLDRHVDGRIHASMLQTGTTSGRYSCTSPNLQNLPRIKDEEEVSISPLVLKYANAIKEGFIAPEGYVIVNADQEALEAKCFADRSGDKALQEVFHKGLDLYSQVAIKTFNLQGVSADKKADNYLGKVDKEKRQIGKTIALAIAFGAEASRISQILNISWEEANEIVKSYLTAFPSLHRYMQKCNEEAKNRGMVRTQFGRIRHLTDCMWTFRRYGDGLLNYKFVQQNRLQRERSIFKNALNNAKNFPIQGLAAHIMNRALIAVANRIKSENLDAHIVAQTHDEATIIAKEEHADRVAAILKDCLENTTKIAVPLKAIPIIGRNWAESK